MEDMIVEFIENNEQLVYERIVKERPEVIPNDDWYLMEHIDFAIEFVEEYMQPEFYMYLECKEV